MQLTRIYRLSLIFLAWVFLALWGCASRAPRPAAPGPLPPSAESPLIAIRNARVPLDGVLTGGQPTEEQLERVARSGYRTVVNLRTEGENGAWDEEPFVTGLGMRYISIPVAGADGVTVENAERLAEVFADEELRPLFIHCGSGNRIGALFAMKAFHLDGEDAETALAIGLAAGLTRLRPVVEERLVKKRSSPEGG